MTIRTSALLIVLLINMSTSRAAEPSAAWQKIAPYFTPPAEYAGKLGDYRSPLKFEDGSEVKTAADWPRRRAEILKKWTDVLGPWPAVLEKPKVEVVSETAKADHTQYAVRVQVAPT